MILIALWYGIAKDVGKFYLQKKNLKEKETIGHRLSKIIDLVLDDDIDRKEMFI